MKKDLYAFTRALRSMTSISSSSGSSNDKWCSNECKLTLQFDNLSMAANMADNAVNAQNNRKLFAWTAINNNNKQQNPSEKRRTSIDAVKDSVKVIKLTKNVLKAT